MSDSPGKRNRQTWNTNSELLGKRSCVVLEKTNACEDVSIMCFIFISRPLPIINDLLTMGIGFYYIIITFT